MVDRNRFVSGTILSKGEPILKETRVLPFSENTPIKKGSIPTVVDKTNPKFFRVSYDSEVSKYIANGSAMRGDIVRSLFNSDVKS